MTGLPPSWCITTVASISDPLRYGYTASADPEAGGPKLLRITDIQNGQVDWADVPRCEIDPDNQRKFLVSPGDILFARTGGTVGKSFLIREVPESAVFASYLIKVAPAIGVEPRYLYWFFQSLMYWEQIALKKGGLQGNVNAKTLGSIELPFAPTNEQRRIVGSIEAQFDEIDRGVQSLRDAKQAIGLYRQSLLKSAFEGHLTADWRAKNPDKLESPDALLARIQEAREQHYQASLDDWKRQLVEWEANGKSDRKPSKPRRAKPPSMLRVEETDAITEVPDGWLLLTAESVGTVQLGRQRSPKNRSKDFPTKYIRAANITEQGLALDDLLDMDFQPHERDVYRLEQGDLLLAEASGSASQVGKAAIWADQVPNCCFQNTVIRHRPHCREFAPFLLWLYRHFYVNGTFSRVAGGVGINHLSASRFAQIPLPICSPAEQAEIVRTLDEHLETADSLQAEIDANLTRAEALRQSILKQAFSGKLVPQDPNDEPAQALLARIRASREGSYVTTPRAMGLRPGHNLDRIQQLVAQTEGERAR